MSIDTSTFFSALDNEVRLRCLVLLQSQGELCVCELTHALDLSQPMISRHLALLRDNGIVEDRRKGQWIYYQINPALPGWMKDVLETTAQANARAAPFTADKRALCNMPNRPGAACCA
ncbi:MAG: metalloregulator ArsR/SmtB family transcription factor [Gammaproteobacteria bacterium]